jgi:hypothetical protein
MHKALRLLTQLRGYECSRKNRVYSVGSSASAWSTGFKSTIDVSFNQCRSSDQVSLSKSSIARDSHLWYRSLGVALLERQ